MKNFICEYKNSLTKEQCEYIISWFESHPNLHSSGEQGAGEVDPGKKDSTDIGLWFDRPDPPDSYDVNKCIWNACCDGLKKYTKKFPEVDWGIYPWRMMTKYNLQRYYPNQGFHELHCEKNGKQFSDRVMAWMIYLNTVTDKGQTYFPQHQVKVKAERGKLVLWPAGWTHFHKGIASKTQTKYIATGWVSFT